MRLPARLLQHPLADRDDQIRFLRDWDELPWRHHAMLRMFPARQRLNADDRAGRQIEFRLVMQPQFVTLNGAAQVGLQLESFHREDVHAGIVDRVGGAADRFGVIERDVGHAQQIARERGRARLPLRLPCQPRTLRRHGNADAGRE